jgi:hypothetical protein
VKCLGHEVDHSSPSSAEVKNAWSYTSSPQYIFKAWCLVTYCHYLVLNHDTFSTLLSSHILLSCICYQYNPVLSAYIHFVNATLYCILYLDFHLFSCQKLPLVFCPSSFP